MCGRWREEMCVHACVCVVQHTSVCAHVSVWYILSDVGQSECSAEHADSVCDTLLVSADEVVVVPLLVGMERQITAHRLALNIYSSDFTTWVSKLEKY